jgi:hypothetical protein
MRGGFVIHAVSGVAGYLSQLFGTPGREAHCTKCGGANFFRQPEVCLQRKLWHVAQHNGAKHEPLGHQISRRNHIQVFSLLGSQATGLANAEYDLTVVPLANKDARATKLRNQTPTRPGWSTSTSTLSPITRSATAQPAISPSTPLFSRLVA